MSRCPRFGPAMERPFPATSRVRRVTGDVLRDLVTNPSLALVFGSCHYIWADPCEEALIHLLVSESDIATLHRALCTRP